MEGTPAEARSELFNLPFDLQAEMMTFLDPHSILSLRKTCSTFYHATSRKIIWVSVLRRICFENSVFLPTFSFSDMSLLELEYAATAPRRWISLPECSNPKEFLLPDTTRLLRPPRQVLIDLGNQEPGIITSLYLIPGGRYLVTFAWNWIGVWDLGMTLSCVEDFQPLAIASVRYDSMFLVHPTPDGRGFRIYLSSDVDVGGSDSNDSDGSDDDHEQLSEFAIYEIYPADDHAELERIAELQNQPRHSSFCSLSDNRLVILHDSYVKIWDFKLNTWAAWTVEANLDCLQIIVTPKVVILIHTRGIDIWATPPLSSRKPAFFESHIAPVAPLFSISFPDIDLLGSGSYCEGPCDWYSGLPQPLLFDIADTSFPDTIARYKILLDDDLTEAELVRLSTTYFPLGDGVFEPYRFCEGTLVAWWSNNRDRVRGIRTSSSTPGEATDPTFVSKAYALCPMDQQMIADSSFCPISGRFVCLEGWQGILIFDYLVPCPETETYRSTAIRRGDRLVEGASIGPINE